MTKSPEDWCTDIGVSMAIAVSALAKSILRKPVAANAVSVSMCTFGLLIAPLVITGTANAQSSVNLKAPSNAYVLGPQDQLKLRILEWRAGAGEYKEWTALNGEYTVSASGSIVVPLIGAVRAARTTTEKLSVVIAQRLKSRVGLAQLPDVAIEIATHRPVYIVGEVQQPGEFPYRPGMTALKLVAIAGGVYRDTQNGKAAEVGKVAAERALAQAQIDLRRAYVRRSRLNAELALVEALEFSRISFPKPAELTNGDDVVKLMLDERRILTSRIEGFRAKHSAFKALIKLLRQEGDALNKKVKTLETQIKVAEVRNGKTQDLWKKRFVSSTLRLNVERDLAQLKGQMLDQKTTTLRVKQDISKAQRGTENARTDYLALVTTELQDIDATIDRLKGVVQKQLQLLQIAVSDMPGRAKLGQQSMNHVAFTIRRSGAPETPEKVIRANATTPVLPGDVVVISVPLDDRSSDATLSGLSDSRSGRSGSALFESSIRKREMKLVR